MNSWTDILLVLAIAVGLISAASLPVVSVNAVSSDTLRIHRSDGIEPAPPWNLVCQGSLETWGMQARAMPDDDAVALSDGAIDLLATAGRR